MIPIVKGLYFDAKLGLILHLQEDNAAAPKHIQLDAKLASLFHLLLENQGELVSRSAFVEAVWEGNRWVGPKALTRNISRLRVLLKEHGLAQHCQIKTFPKKGYALLIDGVDTRRTILTRRMEERKTRIWLALAVVFLTFGLPTLFLIEVEDEEDYELILQKGDQPLIFEDIVQQD